MARFERSLINPDSSDIDKTFRELDQKLLQNITDEEKKKRYDHFDENLNYNFTYRHRGVLLMISNPFSDDVNSDGGKTELKIFENDTDRAKEVLTGTPFSYLHVVKFVLVTHSQMEHIFKKASELEGLKYCSSFVFHFAGHGGMKFGKEDGMDMEYLCSCDKKNLELPTLVSYFSDKRCPNLAGKPKIFLIDACRTDDDVLHRPDLSSVDITIPDNTEQQTLESAVADSNRSGTQPSSPMDEELPTITVLSSVCPRDFIIVHSCVKGQPTGSGLISTGMKETIDESNDKSKVNFIEFITSASRNIIKPQHQVSDTDYVNNCTISTPRLLPFQHRLRGNIVYKSQQ